MMNQVSKTICNGIKVTIFAVFFFLLSLTTTWAASSISGYVYDSGGGVISEDTINVQVWTGDPCGWRDWVDSTNASPVDGSYTFSNLPDGTYHLETSNIDQSNYVNEFYSITSPNSPNCAGATSVPINSGSPATGINFNLELGSSILGTVFDSAGTPIDGNVNNIYVSIQNATDACSYYTHVTGAGIDASGNYTIMGVPSGSYFLKTNAYNTDYQNEWYTGSLDPSSPDCSSAISLSAPAIDINFQLDEGANQNGVVDPGETNPSDADTDSDGMQDLWEVTYGLDPTTSDAFVDTDLDGFSNLREFVAGTNPDLYGEYPACIAGEDNDTDGVDLALFKSEYDRTNCSTGTPCSFDIDSDGDVDETDLKFFTEDFGRDSTTCGALNHGISLTPYDNFSSLGIDPQKWGYELFIREVRNGQMYFEFERTDNSGSNQLNLTTPETVTSLSADVTVLNYSASGASPLARVRGVFYNDGSPGAVPGSSIGDIFAAIQAYDSTVFYTVRRCVDDGCNVTDKLTSGSLGAIQLGDTHNLSLVWNKDNSLFEFILDNNSTVTFNPTGVAPVIKQQANRPFAGIGSKIFASSGQSGYIKTVFDNISINGDPYDDFSLNQLDFTKWSPSNLEVSRVVQGGKLKISRTSESISQITGVHFRQPLSNDAMYAEVKVTEYEKNGGYTRARLGGRFYNDAEGSTTYLGDVWAEIGVTGSNVYYLVSRSTNDNGTAYVGISGDAFSSKVKIGTVALGQTHSLFMQWDGSHFAFQLDSNPLHFFDPATAGSSVANATPNNPIRVIGVKTGSVIGTRNKVTATFDNIRSGDALQLQ